MNINAILLSALGDDMEYNFADLPITEAAADANHFVVEAAGGANANETGVGGGLTGANLDLTRFGTVGAVSSGWRAISALGGFSVTNTFIDTFLRNSTGFAILWHLKDFNFATYARVLTMSGTSPVAWSIDVLSSGYASISAGCTAKWGVTAIDFYGGANDVFPASGEAWVLLSVDYVGELTFFGVAQGATKPTKVSEFILAGVAGRAIAPAASAMTATAAFNNILGVNSGAYTSAPFSFKSITAKLGPAVTRV